ncbi:type II toxin-antitoxin system PemK/MazF family toxin [Phototrophicus methaneseepsis]
MNQGDIYWLQLEGTDEGGPRIPHPHVIVQDDVLNHSRIHTVVVCALTSNLKKASMPGNVLLEAGEANLPNQSVVEVSKVLSVEKAQLGTYIGTLSKVRIEQIWAGMRFVQTSFFRSP